MTALSRRNVSHKKTPTRRGTIEKLGQTQHMLQSLVSWWSQSYIVIPSVMHSIDKWEKKKGSVSKKEGKRKDHSVTWNTVRQDWPKLLNVLRDSSLANRPPKICIPRRAKMKMKRMRSTSRALMEAMELTKLLTRLPMLAQYLHSHISVIPLVGFSTEAHLTWSL